MARRHYSSIAARTTLASGVDDTTTTFVVVAVSNWPASYPYTLIVDQDTVNEEIVEVTGRSGTTLTVTRGVDGSSAVAHSSGAAVNHGVSARDFDEPNEYLFGTGSGTLTDDLASKLPYSYGTATPSTSDNGFLWYDSNSTPPTPKFWDGAAFQALGGGTILQIVRATDTTRRSTTSTSFVDVTGMSVTITPQESSSSILVVATARLITSSSINTDNQMGAQITDASNNPLAGAEEMSVGFNNLSGSGGNRRSLNSLNLWGWSTPATTSPTTYKVRFRSGSASVNAFFLNDDNTGQLFAIEISS